MGKASGCPLLSRSITSSSDRLGIRTIETPKADAAGSGTRDWSSIMQRKPAGLLHYYMPGTQAVCTTENEENLARRSPNWRQFPAWSSDSAFRSRLQIRAPGGMTECYRIRGSGPARRQHKCKYISKTSVHFVAAYFI